MIIKIQTRVSVYQNREKFLKEKFTHIMDAISQNPDNDELPVIRQRLIRLWQQHERRYLKPRRERIQQELKKLL